MTKNILAILALVAVFGAGIWTTKYYYSFGQVHTQEQANVLLERIKTVAKLTTVEGYFSEVYTHEEYYQWDYSPFRKKALIRVKAKVSVGYDLGKMTMEADAATQQVILSNLPDPEILSIDHEIDYYDIQEGTFNYFSEADYTRLNKKAKEFIGKKAISDEIGLLTAAEEQMNEMLDAIRFIVEATGWELKIETVYETKKRDTLPN